MNGHSPSSNTSSTSGSTSTTTAAIDGNSRFNLIVNSITPLPSSAQYAALLEYLREVCHQQEIAEKQSLYWEQQYRQQQQKLEIVTAHLNKIQHNTQKLSADVELIQQQINNTMQQTENNQNPQKHSQNRYEPEQLDERKQQLIDSLSLSSQLHPTFSNSSTLSTAAFSDSTIDFNDFATTLATMEAKLAVERRQRESEQQAQTTVLSPPHSNSNSLSSSSSSSTLYHQDHTLSRQGTQLVKAIFTLFAGTSTQLLSFKELTSLCQRVGRIGSSVEGKNDDDVEDGDDENGDLWWTWQSYASEHESGSLGITEKDLIELYEKEWDLDNDSHKLGIT